MSESKHVAVIIGSLRKASVSRRMAHVLADVAPQGLDLEIVEIGELALYNEDIEADGAPAPWREFRERVAAADAVLFVTPEYNRSVPAALKNALDVGSRPYGQSVWNNKPGAIVSLSPGAVGGFGANHHLRQSMVFLNVPTMQQPEAYIGGAWGLFDESGAMTNEGTKAFLQKFMEAFAAWISAHT
jgi:chromate reductase